MDTVISKSRECMSVLLSLLLAGGALGADPADISVVGLSQGRAVVTLGDSGRPRVLREGDTLPNGAKLIKATPESAVFELDGKRRSLNLGSAKLSGGASERTAASVTLVADGAGHFVTAGTINGVTVKFLVDTGASLISMGVGDARRIGLNYLQGQPGLSRTANGVVQVYRVKLDTVRLGEITLNNVDAVVHGGDMPWVLLGMSFLNRVQMSRNGDELKLVKRF
jgi:aspartyl protease family protein